MYVWKASVSKITDIFKASLTGGTYLSGVPGLNSLEEGHVLNLICQFNNFYFAFRVWFEHE